MEELKKYLEEYNLKIPFAAINENDVFGSLNNVKELLKNYKTSKVTKKQ